MEFPWFYIDNVTHLSYGNNSGFTHVVYEYRGQQSEWYPFIKPIIWGIEEVIERPITDLLRIRVGFLPKTNQPNYDYNTPHVDFLMNHYTACYYVNDSDGDTVVFNESLDALQGNITEESVLRYVEDTNFTILHKCEPQKGRLCVFNGRNFHASSKPKNHERRLVLTVNFI
jgi:hypothetical protein